MWSYCGGTAGPLPQRPAGRGTDPARLPNKNNCWTAPVNNGQFNFLPGAALYAKRFQVKLAAFTWRPPPRRKPAALPRKKPTEDYFRQPQPRSRHARRPTKQIAGRQPRRPSLDSPSDGILAQQSPHDRFATARQSLHNCCTVTSQSLHSHFTITSQSLHENPYAGVEIAPKEDNNTIYY